MATEPPANLFRELHELVTARLNGRITAEQLARLEELVLHQPQARALYVRYIQDTVALDLWASRRQAVAPARPAQGSYRTLIRWSVALAACVALALGIYLWPTPAGVMPTLAAAINASWEHAGQPATPTAGGAMTGRWRLTAGLAEIALADNTRVIIEGPADVEVTAIDRLMVHAGQVFARVSGPDARLIIATPDGELIDRGTEFGVRVRPDTQTEVHVFQGRVEAKTAASASDVAAGSAVRLAAGQATAIPLDSAGFTRYLPEPGLLGEYFDQPDLTERVTVRVDPFIDYTDSAWFNAPPGTQVTPDASFSERWTGYVRLDRPGPWRFHVTSNDGVRLWINGKLVIDNWKTHTEAENSAQLNLPAGWHAIRLEHFQQDKTMAIRLGFSGPDQAKRIIPASRLSVVHPQTGERAQAN